MKLSKKFLTVLVPIATVSAVAPIASCSSTLVINFGDSVNCLNKDKKFKEIADYHKREEVYVAAKLNAQWAEPGTTVTIDSLNEDPAKIQNIYLDFICSMYFAKRVFCVQSTWDKETEEFTTFNFWYQELDEKDKPTGEIIEKSGSVINTDNFIYTTGDVAGKVYIKLVPYSFTLLSYSYQEAKVI